MGVNDVQESKEGERESKRGEVRQKKREGG